MALDPADYPPDVNRLIRRQNAIGWKHLWLGRFSVEWSDMQDDFIRETRLVMTRRRRKS